MAEVRDVLQPGETVPKVQYTNPIDKLNLALFDVKFKDTNEPDLDFVDYSRKLERWGKELQQDIRERKQNEPNASWEQITQQLSRDGSFDILAPGSSKTETLLRSLGVLEENQNLDILRKSEGWEVVDNRNYGGKRTRTKSYIPTRIPGVTLRVTEEYNPEARTDLGYRTHNTRSLGFIFGPEAVEQLANSPITENLFDQLQQNKP